MRVLALISVLAITACGIDGAPLTPAANLGVTITPDGIKPTATVGVSKGPVSIGLDL